MFGNFLALRKISEEEKFINACRDYDVRKGTKNGEIISDYLDKHHDTNLALPLRHTKLVPLIKILEAGNNKVIDKLINYYNGLMNESERDIPPPLKYDDLTSQREGYDYSIIEMAVRSGNLDIIKKIFSLVEMVYNVRNKENGISTDHRLEQKTALEAKNNNGEDSLFIACIYGFNHIIKYLIVDMGVNCAQSNKQGYTPLMAACKYCRINTIEMFIKLCKNRRKDIRLYNIANDQKSALSIITEKCNEETKNRFYEIIGSSLPREELNKEIHEAVERAEIMFTSQERQRYGLFVMSDDVPDFGNDVSEPYRDLKKIILFITINKLEEGPLKRILIKLKELEERDKENKEKSEKYEREFAEKKEHERELEQLITEKLNDLSKEELQEYEKFVKQDGIRRNIEDKYNQFDRFLEKMEADEEMYNIGKNLKLKPKYKDGDGDVFIRRMLRARHRPRPGPGPIQPIPRQRIPISTPIPQNIPEVNVVFSNIDVSEIGDTNLVKLPDAGQSIFAWNNIAINDYLRRWLEGRRPLGGRDDLGCGLNALTFLGVFDRLNGERLLRNIEGKGTTFDQILQYVTSRYIVDQRRFTLSKICADIRSTESVEAFIDYLKNRLERNQAIVVKLTRYADDARTTLCNGQRLTPGHTVVYGKNENDQIYTIDPQQVFARVANRRDPIVMCEGPENIGKAFRVFQSQCYVEACVIFIQRNTRGGRLYKKYKTKRQSNQYEGRKGKLTKTKRLIKK